MDKVIIIGGGESVANMDVGVICSRGHCIGVNDSAVYAPVDEGLSMDRRWAEYRYEQLKGQNLPLLLRRTATQNLPKEDYGIHYTTFDCTHDTDELAEAPVGAIVLNGRNSGYCALNLAYQYAPKQIFLFGLDMEGGYWYPPYPWAKEALKAKSQAWIDGFAVAKKQCEKKGIEVFIVGESKITDFPIISYQDFLCVK